MESMNNWRLTEPVHITPLVSRVLEVVKGLGVNVANLAAVQQAMGDEAGSKQIDRALHKQNLQVRTTDFCYFKFYSVLKILALW